MRYTLRYAIAAVAALSLPLRNPGFGFQGTI
jgi:hypothetical protein